MCRLVSILILIFLIELCFAFPPNADSLPESPESKSHEHITRLGVYSGVVNYLKHKKYVTGIFANDYQCIKEYFSSDSDGLQRFEEAITTFVRSNNEVQKERFGEAKISFNGEQIREGHNKLVTLREKIDHEAKEIVPNSEEMRTIIGQYLYTLQSFYSNTNWIEIRGVTVYADLGIKGAEIMDIASPVENTCKNSYSGQKHLGHCPNNIIVENKLTSGYRGDQDVKKPRSLDYNQGKCSHGGPKDTSINITANCGINKETLDSVLSPHNHFHLHAAAAAIKATEHFISDNGTGLIKTLKGSVFEEVFALTKWFPKSLSYAIDVSGSMSNDIASVKEASKRIILNSLNGPADYVLATFNDPDALTTVSRIYDAATMINRIEYLTVSGGGDCPEYALSGIKAAIDYTRDKSDLFVFTDASPKDEDRYDEVNRLAIAKNIKLTFLLTGTCPKRTRRSEKILTENKKRYRRQSSFDSVFESLANATGGSVHSISSSNLSDILESILQNAFPNITVTFNQVFIDYMTRPANSSITLQFYIDNDVTELQLKLTGVQAISDIDLMYPNGDLVNFTSNNNTWKSSGLDAIDISVPLPPTGQWSILSNVSGEISANISGQGSSDFTFKKMKQGADGYMYDVAGNPIAGETYRLVIRLIGNVEQTSLSSLELIDATGTELASYPLTIFTSSNDSIYTANIIMPSMRFFFKIRGTDGDGKTLKRIQWSNINPVQVQLILVPVYEELLINQDYELQYQIRNLGDTTESFYATITDNRGFLVAPTERNHTIAAGQTIQGKFICRPTTNPRSILYTIQVRQFESNEILQKLSKYIYVTSVQRPSCKIVFAEGNCPIGEVTPTNCTFYNWFAITEIAYSSISLSSVRLSNIDANTQLYAGDTSSLYGPLPVNVSGTCCLDIVDLHIQDADGYLATCRLNFRDNGRVTTLAPVISDSDVKNATTKGDKSDNSKIIGIAVGVSAAVVSVVVIIIVFKLVVNYFGSSAKVKDHSILYSTPKAPDRVTNVRFNQSALEEVEWKSKTQTQKD